MALLRLLALRSTDLPRRATVASISLLALIALATWVLIDWLGNQPDPQFYPYGTLSIGWYALLLLAVAALLAWRSRPHADYGSSLTLVLALAPLAILAAWLIDAFTSGWLMIVAYVAALLYVVAYAVHGLKTLTGRMQPLSLLFTLMLLLLFGATTDILYVEPGLWAVQEDDSADPAYEAISQQAESLLFEQSMRIDTAVAALQPPLVTVPAAFFVGFAGMGEQRVFAEEIKLAAQVVGAKYGSERRNLLLINDRRDLQSYPLASPTALHHALYGVAAKMNRERDVLFLALSSHGSKDATISVSNGPLMLHDLSAADVAGALANARIKWRVIVVSSCYSGSFLKALQNPQTIIITASAADRTSFGCADDRDLTYFGEAFYRDALPNAKTLRAAFEAARDAIKEREKLEGITASRPQAFFGKELETYIASMSRLTDQ